MVVCEERTPSSVCVCVCVAANEPRALSHGNSGRSASEHSGKRKRQFMEPFKAKGI